MPEWFAERKIPMKVVRKGISKRACLSRLYSAGAVKIAENMYADLHKDGYDIKYNISMLDCMALARKLTKIIDKENEGASKVMSYLQALTSHELGTYYHIDCLLYTSPSPRDS